MPHDDRKRVLHVLGKEISVSNLNKIMSCTYNSRYLVSVLSVQEQQDQSQGSISNESRDLAYQPEIWRWKYLRKMATKLQGSFCPKLFFVVAYMSLCLNISLVSNLFPFDVGDTDLRTNLFKGGGNDAILTSSFLQQQANRASCLENRFDVGAFRGTYLSNKMELGDKINCSGNLTHQSIFSNWFHDDAISDQKVMDFSNWSYLTVRDLDICALQGALRPNQRGSKGESSCSRFLSHQGTKEKWNHLKRRMEEVAMNFRSQQTFSSSVKPVRVNSRANHPCMARTLFQPYFNFKMSVLGIQIIQESSESRSGSCANKLQNRETALVYSEPIAKSDQEANQKEFDQED